MQLLWFKAVKSFVEASKLFLDSSNALELFLCIFLVPWIISSSYINELIIITKNISIILFCDTNCNWASKIDCS